MTGQLRIVYVTVRQSCFKACFEDVDDHLTLRYKLVDMINQVMKKETKFPFTN